MIQVEHLSKKYGQKTAISDLSFHIKEGEIVGLVGPNGAGKSTTMNILTGFISATSGQVFINGENLFEEPRNVKRTIGYSPEKPPLYGDMTVDEYLRFCYELKGVRLNKKGHIAEICEQVKITDVQKRMIRKLSRGYQQRVGMAQALLGYPKVLILDEPTVGLDPRQMIEMRKLIGSLGGDHTIILSSHILSEIESICGQVILLDKGKMVRFGAPSNLSRNEGEGDGLVVRVDGRGDKVPAVVRKLQDVANIKFLGVVEEGTADFLVIPQKDKDIRGSISKSLAAAGVVVLEMHYQTQSLEEVFLEATGDKKVEKELPTAKADYLGKAPAKYKKAKGAKKRK